MVSFLHHPPKREGDKNSAGPATGFLPFLMARTPMMGEKWLGWYHDSMLLLSRDTGQYCQLPGRTGSGASGAFALSPEAGWLQVGCFQREKEHYQTALLIFAKVVWSGQNEGSGLRLPRVQILPFLSLQCGLITGTLSHRMAVETEWVRVSKAPSTVQGKENRLNKSRFALLCGLCQCALPCDRSLPTALARQARETASGSSSMQKPVQWVSGNQESC